MNNKRYASGIFPLVIALVLTIILLIELLVGNKKISSNDFQEGILYIFVFIGIYLNQTRKYKHLRNFFIGGLLNKEEIECPDLEGGFIYMKYLQLFLLLAIVNDYNSFGLTGYWKPIMSAILVFGISYCYDHIIKNLFTKKSLSWRISTSTLSLIIIFYMIDLIIKS